MLDRLGRAAARFPLRTITVWLVLCAFCGALAAGAIGGADIFSRLTSDAFDISGEANEADGLLDESADETVTLLVHGVDPADPRLAGVSRGIADDLSRLEVEFTDPLAVELPAGVPPPPELASLFSDDGRGVLFVASSSDETDLHEATEVLQRSAAQLRDELAVTAEVGSRQLLVDSLTEISESDLARR